MKRLIQNSIVAAASLAALSVAWFPRTVNAQMSTKPAVPVVKGGTFTAKRQTLRPNGVRLDGDARVLYPGQLDAAADTIALDADDKGLSQVRAIGNVRLKVDIPSNAGSAAVHIESSSRNAILDPRTKVLTLTGNVAGWYQPSGGAKATLGGDKVTLSFEPKNVSAVVEGGTFGMPLPETGALAGIGVVTVSAKTTNLSETEDSTFTGGARAVSSGPRKFEVVADGFTIKRAADGALDTLRTSGRTSLKTDLPAGPSAGALGTPVRFEVTSDTALVKRADNTLTFEGQVQGMYVLQNSAGVRTNYPFSGDRAVLTFIPETATTKADFTLDFSGAPTTIVAPSLNFGL